MSRLPGVLGEQSFHFLRREIPQPQRFGLDVEGAAAGDDGLLGGGMDAVVAHVSDTAQNDALRKAGGALIVPGSQLSQHGKERVANQRVELVDQQHERSLVRFRPSTQDFLDGVVRSCTRQRLRPDVRHEVVVQSGLGAPRGVVEYRSRGCADVLARRLTDLHVDVDATVTAASVQLVPQRQQGGGLPGLTGRVQHKIPFAVDKLQYAVQIETFQGRYAVVLGCNDGAAGVEEPHRGIVASNDCRRANGRWQSEVITALRHRSGRRAPPPGRGRATPRTHDRRGTET